MVPRVPGGHDRQNHPLSPGPVLPGLLGGVGERPGLFACSRADLGAARLPQPLRRLIQVTPISVGPSFSL